jgi:hypothetical protein
MENNVKETKQNRFKSPVFWAGIACHILTILVAFDIIDVSQMETLKVALISISTVVGVFANGNNPTNKKGF